MILYTILLFVITMYLVFPAIPPKEHLFFLIEYVIVVSPKELTYKKLIVVFQISDDEDDTHPNIDTPSLFRWRHQSRLERMEEAQKEKEEFEAAKKK